MEQTSIATKEASRWGGECYKIAYPFHCYHAKEDEPLCDAENAVITALEFQTKAVCKQEQRKELGV